MRVKVEVYGASIPKGELKREIKRMLEVKRIAKELYDLLSEEELDEIEGEVKRKRFSLRDFGDFD